jgi:hypothetical protein
VLGELLEATAGNDEGRPGAKDEENAGAKLLGGRDVISDQTGSSKSLPEVLRA